MLAKKLDQFYTKKEIAIICYNLIKEELDIKKYRLIEPSAWNGSFSDLFEWNFIAMDLDPKKDYIQKKDFFDFCIEESNNIKNITIWNPPFWKNSSLAIKFFNKSALFSDYICMILPKTFKKDSVTNKLDMNFHLVKEINLPKNSFVFEEKEYNVPCVFQIWEKREIKREKIPQKTKTEFFQFTTKSDADIAIRRVWWLAWKVIENFSSYKEASHYFLQIDKKTDKVKIINTLKLIYKELNKTAFNTAWNPSLSKNELINIFEMQYYWK